MKPFPWKCAECKARAVSPATLDRYETDMDHDARAHHVVVSDLPVFLCANCGAIRLDDQAQERLADGLRDAANLLRPSEIRARRAALGLTQKQIASAMEISESTLCRWETGAQIQQRCMDRILRAFFVLPELRHYLGVTPPTGDGASDAPIPSPTALDVDHSLRVELKRL